MSHRVEGIDVARGIASLVMIQGHAYHGWVAPALHDSPSYRLTRVLGTLPLPAFLVLAGAAVGWRVHVAAARGETAHAVRASLVRRGLEVMLWGYLVSAAFMAMDGGEGLDTLLRADVLHVIGLSIATVAWLGVRPPRRSDANAAPPDPLRFTLTAAAVGIGATVLCAPIHAFLPAVEGPLRYVLALFVDVPGVTKMPLFPLIGWLATGTVAARFVWRARETAPGDSLARVVGAPRGFAFGLLAAALGLAVFGAWAMPASVAWLGGTASRAHPAIVFNVLDLAGRGLIVLAAGILLCPLLGARARGVLLRLGRGSLVAYVFHIPFCYGRLGEGWRDQLDMGTATVGVLLLMVASYGAVWARDEARAALRGWAPARPSPRPAPTAGDEEAPA